MENRAGFWIRLVALIIDSIILGVVQFIITLLFGGGFDPTTGTTLSSVISLVITIIYFVWFQTKNNGQTFGKKFTGIRVANLDGNRVSIGMMEIRELIGKTISFFILFIGFIIAAGKSKRALHDYIARTIVIRAE